MRISVGSFEHNHCTSTTNSKMLHIWQHTQFTVSTRTWSRKHGTMCFGCCYVVVTKLSNSGMFMYDHRDNWHYPHACERFRCELAVLLKAKSLLPILLFYIEHLSRQILAYIKNGVKKRMNLKCAFCYICVDQYIAYSVFEFKPPMR